MSNYTKIVDYTAKDALLTGNPSKLVKGAELGPEFDAVATAIATKADSASPTLTGTITAAIANFSGLVTAALGLTVSGAAFNSRGITDNATAKALTLSGSGANSVTITNSATNPTIGTSGGGLELSSIVGIGGAATTTGIMLTIKNSTNGNVQARLYNSGAAPTADIFQTGVDVAAGTGYYHYRAYELLGSAPAAVFSISGNGTTWARSSTATTAGGVTGFLLGSAAIGVYFGSGAPTVSAAKGSLYLRSDGSTTNNRMYVNTDGGTTWTAVTTVA